MQNPSRTTYGLSCNIWSLYTTIGPNEAHSSTWVGGGVQTVFVSTNHIDREQFNKLSLQLVELSC